VYLKIVAALDSSVGSVLCYMYASEVSQ